MCKLIILKSFVIISFFFIISYRTDTLSSEGKSIVEADNGALNGRSRDPINMSDLTLDALMSKSPQVFVQVYFKPFLGSLK